MPVAESTSRKNSKKSGRRSATVTISTGSKRKSARSTAGAVVVDDVPSKGQSRKPTRTRKSGKDHGALPTWRQLESKQNRKRKVRPDGLPFFEAVSTVRFALVLAGVAAAFTLYVGHVHATQDLLATTEQARRENHRLHLKYNRLKGEFDRRTGPSEIHRRAHALGFVEDAAYAGTIIVKQ